MPCFPRWASTCWIRYFIPGSRIPRSRSTRFSRAPAVFGSGNILIIWFGTKRLFGNLRSTFKTIQNEQDCVIGLGLGCCSYFVTPASSRRVLIFLGVGFRLALRCRPDKAPARCRRYKIKKPKIAGKMPAVRNKVQCKTPAGRQQYPAKAKPRRHQDGGGTK